MTTTSPTPPALPTPPHAALAARWAELRRALPALRTRDAAAALGVAEAALVATLTGTLATRLDDDTASLLHALPQVGRCMALTRNEHAVSEVRGRYGGVELGAHVGTVLGEHIDLRVFPAHWRHAFALDEPHPQHAGARRRSIHVFDGAGTAVHKIYLELDGDAHAWDAIVASRRSERPLELTLAPPAPVEHADAAVDLAALLAGWDAMTDTHQFFHLLATHQVSRTQALRLAGPSRARRVQDVSLELLLGRASAIGDRLMIFVGNRGCIQIFSGPLARVVRTGTWLNVLDPDFNLHLRADHIASSWVVSKPTRTGVVTSLELFDAAGEVIALVFRKRADRERAEDPAWHALLDGLPEAA